MKYQSEKFENCGLVSKNLKEGKKNIGRNIYIYNPN